MYVFFSFDAAILVNKDVYIMHAFDGETDRQTDVAKAHCNMDARKNDTVSTRDKCCVIRR